MGETRPTRVLLIEDNPADVYLIEEMIDEANVMAAITVVPDGERAIEWIERIDRGEAERPDVILLDLNLPKRSGFEVLESIRQAEEISSTCVIILSSSCSPDDVRRAMEGGADGYLVKPMGCGEMDALVETLRSVIRPVQML